MRFGQTSSAMPEKHVLSIFIESVLFLRIRVNFSPVERIFDLKRWKMRFAQNVLRIAWKARFVQFSWKAYCFHVLALISVPWAIFGFGTLKNAIWSKHPPHGLKSTFCSIFIQSLLFSSISVTLSPVKRFFGSKTLKNAIWPKRPSHCLKSTFCTIFMESLLFSRICVNFSPVERLFDLKRQKMRFGQNVLRMARKARFVQFSWKAYYSFYVLAWILVRQSDFWI